MILASVKAASTTFLCVPVRGLRRDARPAYALLSSSASFSTSGTTDGIIGKGRSKVTGFSVDRSGLIGGGLDLSRSQNIPSINPNLSLEESKQAIWRLNNSLDGSAAEKNVAADEYDPLNTYPPVPPNKEEMSTLAADLQTYIALRGPITMHDYMLQCANHFVHGYYQTSATTNVKIGAGGDFVTAPEMSQLFGEMIGMWCMSHWMSMGKPKKISLIEMGPGKGTLLKDILSVAKKFPEFKAALHIHLVELSDTMRGTQRTALGCPEPSIANIKAGKAAKDKKKTSKEKEDLSKTAAGEADAAEAIAEALKSWGTSGGPPLRSSLYDVPVSWHHALQQVPEEKGVPTLAIGQEFLDAFPVHQFLFQNGMWKEKLVDVCRSTENEFHFRHVLSPTATPAVRALLDSAGAGAAESGEAGPSVSHSEGDTLEISPSALATCESLGARICRTGGAALLIDYGENYTQGDTCRGFRKHQLVSSLSMPGVTDVTADVDFGACARAAAKRGAVAIGAIPQGEFLVRMGIVDRVQQLMALPKTTDDEALLLLRSLRRLIDAGDMGTRFKVLAILDPSLNSGKELNTIGFPSVPAR